MDTVAVRASINVIGLSPGESVVIDVSPKVLDLIEAGFLIPLKPADKQKGTKAKSG